MRPGGDHDRKAGRNQRKGTMSHGSGWTAEQWIEALRGEWRARKTQDRRGMVLGECRWSRDGETWTVAGRLRGQAEGLGESARVWVAQAQGPRAQGVVAQSLGTDVEIDLRGGGTLGQAAPRTVRVHPQGAREIEECAHRFQAAVQREQGRWWERFQRAGESLPRRWAAGGPGPEASVRLNEEQTAAAEMAAREAVTWIWGPPGTGKTRTLGAIAAMQSKLGRRVLCLGPSNTSVDLLLQEARDSMGKELARMALRHGRIPSGQVVALTREEVAQALVVGTTMSRATTEAATLGAFDTVVVDEASMVTVPAIVAAGLLAPEHVVIGGDPRQLPPVVGTREDAHRKVLETDTFSAAGVVAALAGGGKGGRCVQLDQQYRMGEAVMEVVNRIGYEDRPLRCARGRTRPIPMGTMGYSEVAAVDIAALRPASDTRPGSGSRYTCAEALVARHAAQQAASVYRNVGVTSPYTAQAALLGAVMADTVEGSVRRRMRVRTTHRMQGGEHDVVVVCLTDAPGTPLGVFMRGRKAEDTGSRLVNVAASRAKERLVFIGDMEWLERRAPEGGTIRRLIELLREKAQWLDPVQTLRSGSCEGMQWEDEALDQPLQRNGSEVLVRAGSKGRVRLRGQRTAALLERYAA